MEMWGKGKRKKDNCPSTPPSNSLFILAEKFLGVIAVGDASAAAEARWVKDELKDFFDFFLNHKKRFFKGGIFFKVPRCCCFNFLVIC